MVAGRRYTPAEVAVLSGVAVKAVNNAIDKRIVHVAAPSMGKRHTRRIPFEEVLRLKLWHEVGAVLSRERRQTLFDEISRRPSAKLVKADSLVIVDVGFARKQIADRLRQLDAANAIVTQMGTVMSGEPVFKGTRIPVRLVAFMLDEGVEDAEILDGYPKLEVRHLRLAQIWAAANPRRGRPKPIMDRGLVGQSRSTVSLEAASGSQSLPIRSTD